MKTLGVVAALVAIGFVAVAVGGESRPEPAPVRAGTPSSIDLRAPTEREGFTFLVYGDRTGGKPQGIKILERAVEVSNTIDPDFVMTVGDLINGYNAPEQWKQQAAEYKATVGKLTMPWYPVAGNHDVYGGRARPEGHMDLYAQTFGPLYYSFDYRWGHFIALFSDESLAFSNPAKNQNMSEEQMQWLRDDLAATKAEQVYVFLHHPRWLYKGCNWPRVHDILAKDGRVRAVFAGHIHCIRDDGVKDGVHYFTLGATGAHQNAFPETTGIHHLTHVRVRREGFSASHVALGSVLGSDAMLGTESNLLHGLRRGDWLRLSAPQQKMDAPFEQTLTVRFVNPTDRDLLLDVEAIVPKGWTSAWRKFGLRLAPGRDFEQKLQVSAPAFAGSLASITLKATAHFPFKSGLTQPVHHTKRIPVMLRDVPAARTAASEPNGVLALDGKSALRLPPSVLEQVGDAFTVECWVKGGTSKAREQALISNNENSSIGLWWRDRKRTEPSAAVSVKGRGYVHATAPKQVGDGWHHLAATVDGARLCFFVDGNPVAESKTGNARSTNALSLLIGADPDRRNRPGRYFTGWMDEVRVSRVARYEKAFQPAATHARDDETVLLLHFDHEEERVYLDDSGKDHHGAPIGKPRIERTSR